MQSIMAQKVVESFDFTYQGNTLRGLIEQPKDHQPAALIVIIPGYGSTNFVEGNWYGGLRDKFVDFGHKPRSVTKNLPRF